MNLKLYQLALIHKSASGKYSKNHDIHNERLEFLGDAILDSVVAEQLSVPTGSVYVTTAPAALVAISLISQACFHNNR